jgi:hypothetical protein
MNLKEQLRQNLTGHLSDEKTEVDVNIAAKIAEDFALKFARWVDRKYYQHKYKYNKSKHIEDKRGFTHNIKQLLELFKKENE